jgi:ribokinase
MSTILSGVGAGTKVKCVNTGGVAVVGSINADLTVFGSPLPRPGETVNAERFSLVLGGKGANQAVAAVRAGASTFMIGAVGDDLFRDLALLTLGAEGIDTTAVQVLDTETGIAHIRVDTSTAQNDIAIVAGANHALTPDAVEAALRRLAGKADVVLTQLETPVPVLERTAAVCAELGLQLVIDPAPAQALPTNVWAGVAVVTPNETEAEVLTGHPVDGAEALERAGRWFLGLGVRTVIITLAERGVFVMDGDGSHQLPAFPITPVDTTAAGDAFAGMLGASLARGLTLDQAVHRGLAAGALAATVRGASPSLPTADAVDEFLTAQD